MSSTDIVTKTGAFTIADADISTSNSTATYICTGTFAITIPASGVTAGNVFIIISEDGLQTFTDSSTSNDLPAYRELLPYSVGSGESATMVITCISTGNYKTDGDLNVIAGGDLGATIIYETEITVATDTINVTSSVLGGEEYRLTMSIVNDHASQAAISLFINSDTTATNYNTQTMNGENATAAAAEWNASYIASVNPSKQSLIDGTMSVFDSIFLGVFNEARINTQPMRLSTWGVSNTATTFTTIDDIQLKANQTTGFGVGTRLRILKD